MHRRIQKKVFNWDPAANGGQGAWSATPSADTRFIYDQWNLLLELDGLNSNAVLRKYTWGLDLSGQTGSVGVSPAGLHGAGGIGGLLACTDTATSAGYAYFYDANGNVGQLRNVATGTSAAEYEYDPYGNVLVANGAFAATNPFRFSTKYFIPETAHYDYGRRFYDTRWGRWISRDPEYETADLGLYRFCEDDPANQFDALGLESLPSQVAKTLLLDRAPFEAVLNHTDRCHRACWNAYQQCLAKARYGKQYFRNEHNDCVRCLSPCASACDVDAEFCHRSSYSALRLEKLHIKSDWYELSDGQLFDRVADWYDGCVNRRECERRINSPEYQKSAREAQLRDAYYDCVLREMVGPLARLGAQQAFKQIAKYYGRRMLARLLPGGWIGLVVDLQRAREKCKSEVYGGCAASQACQ